MLNEQTNWSKERTCLQSLIAVLGVEKLDDKQIRGRYLKGI